MNGLIRAVKQLEEYKRLLTQIEKNLVPVGMTGLSNVHKAHFVSALCEDTKRKTLIVTSDEAQASRITEDLRTMGVDAYLYPARDFVLRSSQSQSREYEHKRLGVLEKMITENLDVAVCSAEAAAQLTIPKEELQKRSVTFEEGKEYSIEEIKKIFMDAGYVNVDEVDGIGEFAIRGGVIDFFPPGCENPCRMELWGDEIDSIGFFDVESQRKIERAQSVKITPANEVLAPDIPDFIELLNDLYEGTHGKGSVKSKKSIEKDLEMLESGIRLASTDKYMPLLYSEASIFDYAKDYNLVISESFAVKEKFDAAVKLMDEEVKSYLEDGELSSSLNKFTLTQEELIKKYETMRCIYMDNLPRGSFDTPIKALISVSANQTAAWNGSISVLKEDLRLLGDIDERTVLVFAGTQKTAESIGYDLENDGLKAAYYEKIPDELIKGQIAVVPGNISTGIDYPKIKFSVFSHTGRTAANARKRVRRKNKNAFHSLDELTKGDYVVHDAHGIGIFDGIKRLEAGGTIKDYIKIRYAKGDVLYLPITQLDQVSRYIGASSDDKPLKLSRLGGKDWEKTKSKVRSAVASMAKELTALYAKRLKIEGHAFSPDIDMQNDFERRFAFEETSDQLRCIDEIKNDMEKPYPMDRLLCGDVGFGKTEVALRAAFKCIADGKQCAILVPTTILAFQHYQTVLKRLDGFPVEARMLSRFCSRKEVTQTLKDIRRGSADIVVGTHRLISKDVEFRDLGLIIIDEEQRFGVAQKEKLKKLYPNVDVLTLTATPIPRTLNMALSGIRDMSTLEEAPMDRSPVQTYVLEHDPQALAQAMKAELRRGGQVYYLYNRVESIEEKASEIQELLPEARIGIAHGKMSEDELSEVWRALLEDEIDILVCTTIIETGVDIPNANTLIIEDADRMGLSQLHQIRGRVGRSSRRASAYLTYRQNKSLSEIATNRLDAIRKYTEFGSGFKIAMRDLELRGAGSILGGQQHGHMEAVGYDMYLELLDEAIKEEKGEKAPLPKKECLVDLPIDAYIPSDYIQSVPQRLGIYRRIADIKNGADYDDVLDELIDRFGEPPEPVMGLLKTALLRSYATNHEIYEISRNGEFLNFYCENPDMEKYNAVVAGFHDRIKISVIGKNHIGVKIMSGDTFLGLIEKVLMLMNTIDIQKKRKINKKK